MVMQGQAIPKDRWRFAIAGLMASAPLIAESMKKNNFAEQGKEAAESYMADIELAIHAMEYVAEFAADKIKFVALDDAAFEAAIEKMREMGTIR